MDSGIHPDDDDRFNQAPYFNFNNGKVNFDVNRRDNANWNYAAPSLLR
jgi:hypothetical protein